MSHARTSRLIDDLRERIGHLEGGSAREAVVLPFGVPDIDDRLPGGGLVCGALHEIAGGGSGTVDGAAAALFAAGIAARAKGKVLWCLTRPDLFAPSVSQAGLHPDRGSIAKATRTRMSWRPWRKGCRSAASRPSSGSWSGYR